MSYNKEYGVYNKQSSNTKINAEDLKYSNSAQHSNKPYQNSTQTIQEIIDSKATIADPSGSYGLLWKVEGTYGGKIGEYELLNSPDKTTIWHFLFKSYKWR